MRIFGWTNAEVGLGLTVYMIPISYEHRAAKASRAWKGKLFGWSWIESNYFLE